MGGVGGSRTLLRARVPGAGQDSFARPLSGRVLRDRGVGRLRFLPGGVPLRDVNALRGTGVPGSVGVLLVDIDDGELLVDVYEEDRSEEHTSELQSRFDIVCRLLLEKKKENTIQHLAIN